MDLWGMILYRASTFLAKNHAQSIQKLGTALLGAKVELKTRRRNRPATDVDLREVDGYPILSQAGSISALLATATMSATAHAALRKVLVMIRFGKI